ncbi:NF-kappa-B inhibitor-like protein 1 [Dysidea avara]|uniref:NF-kappa-B inhibitor-like protein 1 n=1 Tax=Dysidea avara TaxID=196820 RepID=UPI003327C7D3
MSSVESEERTARKKLKKYVQRGNVKKLRKLISQTNFDFNLIVDRSKGWGALHLACDLGQWEIVTFLVKNGSDVSFLDSNLISPVHILLHKACSWVKYDYSEPEVGAMLECTLLVLHASQKIDADSFKWTDNEDMAVIDLIEYLVDQLTVVKCDHSLLDELLGHLSHISVDGSWNTKIKECYFDDVSQDPFEGYSSDVEYAYENFDTFADRITRERQEKKRGKCEEEHVNRKKAKKSFGPPLKLKPESPKLDVLKVKKETYEENYQLFIGKEHSSVSFDDIPWPGGSHATAAEQAKVCLYSSDPQVSRSVVRDQQRRWHPDKFVQLFGQCLSENERDKILEHVKQLSQAINDYDKVP